MKAGALATKAFSRARAYVMGLLTHSFGFVLSKGRIKPANNVCVRPFLYCNHNYCNMTKW